MQPCEENNQELDYQDCNTKLRKELECKKANQGDSSSVKAHNSEEKVQQKEIITVINRFKLKTKKDFAKETAWIRHDNTMLASELEEVEEEVLKLQGQLKDLEKEFKETTKSTQDKEKT